LFKVEQEESGDVFFLFFFFQSHHCTYAGIRFVIDTAIKNSQNVRQALNGVAVQQVSSYIK
jgi:hypothetical protein